MDLSFSSVQELYQRLRPALRSKLLECKKGRLKEVAEEDIFHYLKETKWQTASDLSLYEMVDDILHVSVEEIKAFTNATVSSSHLKEDEII